MMSIEPGERIAQLVLAPFYNVGFEKVDELYMIAKIGTFFCISKEKAAVEIEFVPFELEE